MASAGRVITWCVLGMLALPAAARADEGEDAAREFNRAGLEAYGRADHDEALRNFEKAYALKPDSKVRLNMALACENLMRLDDAAAHYEAFLQANPSHPKAAGARKQLADLKARMKQWGKLVIMVSPPADAISVGGRTFSGESVAAWVPPGQYALSAQKAGHVRHASVVRVDAGARVPIRVELAPLPAEAPPAGAAAALAPRPESSPPPAQADEPPPPATVQAQPAGEPAEEPVPVVLEGRPPGLMTFTSLAATGTGLGVAALMLVAGIIGCVVPPLALVWPILGVAGTAGGGAVAWFVGQRWLRWRTSLLVLAAVGAGPTLACAVPAQIFMTLAWGAFIGASVVNASVQRLAAGDLAVLPSALASSSVCFMSCMCPVVFTYVGSALVGPVLSAFVLNEWGRVKDPGDETFHVDILPPPSNKSPRAARAAPAEADVDEEDDEE